MIAQASLLETDLILYLGQRCAIKIPPHPDLKSIEGMSSETQSAPSPVTNRKMTSANTKVGPNNPPLEGHSTLTFVTGHGPVPPFSSIPA